MLVDYGLVRAEEPTITEIPAWTAPYLAREVHIDKTRTSRASDMWALAATAFFALTGKQPDPFDTDLMRTQLQSALAGQVDHPEAVEAELMAVLDEAPEQRPSSPSAWAAGLAAACGGSGRAVGPDTPIAMPEPVGLFRGWQSRRRDSGDRVRRRGHARG